MSIASLDISDAQITQLRDEAAAAGDDVTVLLCACALGDMDEAMEDYADVVGYDRVLADYYPAYATAHAPFAALQIQSMDHARRLLTLQVERAAAQSDMVRQ